MNKKDNNQLYQAELMDHYKNPRNKKKLQAPDFSSGVFNPSCGDNVSFEGIVKDNKLVEVAFQGSGCVISQATASMLSESIKNQDIDKLQELNQQDILNLVKINLGPARLRCGLISLEALQHGLDSWQEREK
jgi:nitrogen fixation NifU-like protein